MRKKPQKPLATIGGRVKARIYRSRFRPAEHIKYLDMAALKRVNKAVIEVGWVEAARKKVSIVAEVRRGMITKIRPVGCDDCPPGMSKSAARRPAVKKAAREAVKRVRELGDPTIKLPLPVTRLRSMRIGPIVIIIFNGGWDICIEIEWPDGESCLYCLFGPGICIGPVVIL